MHTTPHSLLQKLRDRTDQDSWKAFCTLYAPMILEWARKQGFQEADAEDVCQQVLVKLLRELPNYRPESGKFRVWLATLTRNQGIDFRRRKENRSLGLGDDDFPLTEWPAESEFEEEDYRLGLVRRVQRIVRPDFHEQTWTAFSRAVLQGTPAAEVAAEMGISVNAVYIARNRVLARIREVLAGFLD